MKRQPRILAGTALGLLMASAPLGAVPLLKGAATEMSPRASNETPTAGGPPCVRASDVTSRPAARSKTSTPPSEPTAISLPSGDTASGRASPSGRVRVLIVDACRYGSVTRVN